MENRRTPLFHRFLRKGSHLLRVLLPILGITFIDILGFSIMISLLPFFVQHFGVKPIVVGWTFTIYAGFQFLAAPVWGAISDRIGRRRVLIFSQMGAVVSWLMLAFATSMPIVFLARALEGISGGNLSLTHAYVADMVEPEKRGRAMAYVGAAFSAGMVFGPGLGGFLYSKYGYTAPFLAAAVLQVITVIITIAILPESLSKSDEETPKGIGPMIASLREPRVAPLLWQRLLFALGLYGWFAVFTLILAAQLHYDAAHVSYLFAAFGAASVLFGVGVVGKITDRFGDRLASTFGIGLTVAVFACAPFVHNLITALCMIALFAAGLSLTDAALPSMLSKAVPDNRRGAILGVGSSLENLSGVFMPPLSTGVLQMSGVPATAAVSAVFVLAAFIVGVFSGRKERAEDQPAHAGNSDSLTVA